MPLAIGLALAAPSRAADDRPDIADVLARVGERLSELYRRAERVICTETSTVQTVDITRTPRGFARTVESELRIEGDASGTATVVREVRKVNGRPPRDRDKTDRAGCMDPQPSFTDPRAFLLPPHAAEYEFHLAGSSQSGAQAVWLVDFATRDRTSALELVEDEGGHDDCFTFSGRLASRGRLWVLQATYDVIRVDIALRAPLDVRVPSRIQQRHQLDTYMVIDRMDTSVRYAQVAFSDPDEVLLLPKSVDSLRLMRGGLESSRSRQVYSNYRRFVTGARIVG